MKHRFLKHKLIIVFLFFLFIVTIKQFVFKEGNEISNQSELRNKAAEIQFQSQEYQNLANEGYSQANRLINQAELDETNALIKKSLEEEIERKKIKDEQERIYAEELRLQEIKNKEIEDRKIKQQIEYTRQVLQNDYQDANKRAEYLHNFAKQLELDCENLRKKIYDTDMIIRDFKTKANDARQRNQPYWNDIAQKFYIKANEFIAQIKIYIKEYENTRRKLDEIMKELNNINNKVRDIKQKIANL